MCAAKIAAAPRRRGPRERLRTGSGRARTRSSSPSRARVNDDEDDDVDAHEAYAWRRSWRRSWIDGLLSRRGRDTCRSGRARRRFSRVCPRRGTSSGRRGRRRAGARLSAEERMLSVAAELLLAAASARGGMDGDEGSEIRRRGGRGSRSIERESPVMARRGGYSSTNLRCYNSKQSKKFIFIKTSNGRSSPQMEPTEQRETLRDLPAAGGLHGLVAGLAAVNGQRRCGRWWGGGRGRRSTGPA